MSARLCGCAVLSCVIGMLLSGPAASQMLTIDCDADPNGQPLESFAEVRGSFLPSGVVFRTLERNDPKRPSTPAESASNNDYAPGALDG